MCATVTHVTETRKRAAVYLRISQDREGEALGVDRQEQACRDLCEREGLDVVAVYPDNDRSASKYGKKRREKYEAMMTAARAAEFDVIVAYSSSRLTRRLREALDLIELAEKGSVQIRTVVSGQYDLSTASGRMIAKVFATFDEGESEVNSERSRAEREQRRVRGRPNGGQRPFGWLPDGITPHPVEWPALARGAEDLLAGVSLARIARDWSAATGRRIRTPTVRRVLGSRRIEGRLPDGRPGVWEPVVDAERAAALRGALAGTHPAYAQHLLTGWALCGRCRAPVNAAVTHRGKPAYKCSAVEHLRVSRPERDEYVRELIAAYLNREHVETVPDTAPIAARLATTATRLADVAEAFAAGEITRAQTALATARLRAQQEDAERAMAAAARIGALPDTGAVFLALDTARQRAVLSALPWRVVLLSPGRGRKDFNPETVRVEPL